MRGDTSKRETSQPADDGDSGPSTLPADSRVGHATENFVVFATQGLRNTCPGDILLVLSKIMRSLSNVRTSLSKFAYVERNRLLIAIVITCLAASILGWVFPFTRDVVYRLIFTLLASFPLSVWFGREYAYRRRLDERVEALQHHVAVILTTLHASPPFISKGSANNGSEVPVIGLGSGDAEHRARRPGLDNELPIPTKPLKHSPSPLPIEHTLRKRPHSANPPSPNQPASPPRARIAPLVPGQVQDPNTPGVPSHGKADMPHRRPPSSPRDAQKKPRSPNFFDRIKMSFSPRPVSSVPPSHATTTS